MKDATVNEQSHFKISLPMAIQATALVVVLVMGYSALDSRISFLEHEVNVNTDSIEDMEAKQDDPIPSDVKQDVLIQKLEKQVDRNNKDIEFMIREKYSTGKGK